MESLEKRIERIEYYQMLLLNMMEGHQFPVYELIIKSQLSRDEVKELFSLCEELSQKYEEQKEQGFIHFHSLLTHFIGMLNTKLDPEQTIDAFYLQDMYKPLMEKLKESIIKVR